MLAHVKNTAIEGMTHLESVCGGGGGAVVHLPFLSPK